MPATVSAPRTVPMGATPHEEGVSFRVWAPHANQVSVVGTFNDWDETAHRLERDDQGFWSGDAAEAAVGDEYRFVLKCGEQTLSRIDPYAREVTNSVGNGIVADAGFDWAGDDFELPPRESLVIYELHVGTFGRSLRDRQPGQVADFEAAVRRLDYLKELGVNCVELMPVSEFAGDISWGYNPAHIFAVESCYGGPRALKNFVREAHARGIGVIQDVVYNHLGPSDLDLWRFDGWSENGKGGIYFYNDWRAATPWGDSRPDYGRPEVRQYIRDNAVMWIEEFHMDGLRMDMTLYIRRVRGDGDPGCDLPDGWSLTQWINDEVRKVRPGVVTIAEDLQNNEWLTKPTGEGGAGFTAQWAAQFVHPVRSVVIAMRDEDRSMERVHRLLEHRYNGDPFQRVIYSESHDEVANGKARVPEEIDGDGGNDWFARKRSTLAALLVFTAPGMPMLFQGQEFLQDGWFIDTVPLDWRRQVEYCGILRLYSDLISLRTAAEEGASRALQGPSLEVIHQDDAAKTIAFRRWRPEAEQDQLIVLCNFHRDRRDVHTVLPEGEWRAILNSDARIYGGDFLDTPAPAVRSDGKHPATIPVGPYAAVIYRRK